MLTNFNQICNSVIFGFIVGSLGVIWPWKTYESKQQIIRYIPEISAETIYAVIYILFGITIVLIMSKYDKR